MTNLFAKQWLRITLSKPKVKTVERRDLEGRPFRAGEKNMCQRRGREKVIHTHGSTALRRRQLPGWEDAHPWSGLMRQARTSVCSGKAWAFTKNRLHIEKRSRKWSSNEQTLLTSKILQKGNRMGLGAIWPGCHQSNVIWAHPHWESDCIQVSPSPYPQRIYIHGAQRRQPNII